MNIPFFPLPYINEIAVLVQNADGSFPISVYIMSGFCYFVLSLSLVFIRELFVAKDLGIVGAGGGFIAGFIVLPLLALLVIPGLSVKHLESDKWTAARTAQLATYMEIKAMDTILKPTYYKDFERVMIKKTSVDKIEVFSAYTNQRAIGEQMLKPWFEPCFTERIKNITPENASVAVVEDRIRSARDICAADALVALNKQMFEPVSQ